MNLGGWLVLERWMTPSVFSGTDAVDEYTFMQTSGAKERLRRHHRDFITEADFQWMCDHGIDAVRIPVGYWILDGDAPFISAIGRLDWVFYMAERYGIQVLISLHGAPGSQNGFDHSGRVGKPRWKTSREHIAHTRDVLCRLAERYRDSPVFWGIELLNEPKFFGAYFAVRRFYLDVYDELARIVRPETHIVFHDAFMPRMMTGVLSGGRHAVMDIHWYHFNDNWRWLPLSWYMRLVKWRRGMIDSFHGQQPVIVGEWSGVLAGEVLKKYTPERQEQLTKEYIALQQEVYQYAYGQFYWSYKTEVDDVWNFRSCVERGVITL